ncbi:transcriptional regulator NrdR [Candidatus Neoehrlichia procyonis]|uniref:Transcriptional repressor NrdR n=1 Tax=Candidatus Neoehrlichia procyonis str. RAC413 TaxID=1359163 RepID=A0A0F3NQR6_9RICK|nr:transcriptional regulator NrdR [Candidatus Neoehrlichia lotoris]KJV69239.1 transcriptional regulator NrdR [Candidatus Neoehrlichia lotoris str. RAC413]
MKCPFCNNIHTNVRDSRPSDDDMIIRRRRTCNVCNARFTTIEELLLKPIKVIKKNGSVEVFSKQKLLSSILIATKKRPISHDQINMVVNNIFYQLEASKESFVSTHIIGKMVMDNIFSLDKVAYIRFASVYMNFNDTNDFSDIVTKIINRRNI